jgi:hypothetical protein
LVFIDPFYLLSLVRRTTTTAALDRDEPNPFTCLMLLAMRGLVPA